MSIKLLDGSTIGDMTEDDILICTGTVRDDIMVRNLVDRKSLPFIVTFTKSSKISNFLENLSLVIEREVKSITLKIIEEIIEIKKSIALFEKYAEASLDRDNEVEQLILLSLYQQVQFFNHQNRFKSATHTLKRRDIYIDIKKNSKEKMVYIILHNDTEFRILKIEQGFYKGEDKKESVQEKNFLINICDTHFEALMAGELVLLKNRKFSFEYIDVTKRYQKDFLLFGLDDKEEFLTYSLYHVANLKRFEHMAIYDIHKKVKNIDKNAELALFSLKAMINKSYKEEEQKILYKNLDVFLFSARQFKSVIAYIKYDEQSTFKRTVISDMFAKIYDNIIEKRELSQLRFALVLLLSSDFEKLDVQIHSHVFYDIINGINLNSQILKNANVEINLYKYQEKIFEEEILFKSIEESSMGENTIDKFIKNSDEHRFIEVFLNTILNMNSTTNVDREKTLLFVALLSYLTSTHNVKTTKRDGIDKIQIEHCYLFMSYLQVKYNINDFFMHIDDFVNLKGKDIEIERFLEERIFYQYREYKKDECIILKIWKKVFFKKKTSLRKINHQFSTRLLVVGLFYQLISKEKKIEDVIANSFKNIRHDTINIELCCKERISTKFLTIFFRGNGKKECEFHLNIFFEKSRFLLKI